MQLQVLVMVTLYGNMVFIGIGIKALDIVEKYIHKLCPYVAAGLLMGSVYWTSVTYGAVTVMQVVLWIDIFYEKLVFSRTNMHVFRATHKAQMYMKRK